MTEKNDMQVAGLASDLNRELDTGIAMNKQLKQILNNVLSGIIKRDDAPCSSETHLNMADVDLLKILPDFKTDGEKSEAVLYAIGSMLPVI